MSVILPTHNGQRYVQRAIESVLNQRGVRVELIVLDDASTDATPQIIDAFGDRVRHVRLAKQPNHIAVTNAGIALARGDYVAILHDDDFYLPGKLSAHVDLMDRYPRVGLSYSAQRYVGPDDQPLAVLRSPVRHRSYVAPGEVELRHLVVQNYINFCNAVVRRSAYVEAGLFPDNLWVAAEWVMWVRLALRSGVGYIDDVLVCYRVHPEGQTLVQTDDTARYLNQLQQGYDLIWREDGMAAVNHRRALSVANVELSMALLHLLRGETRAALRATGRLVQATPPWRYPDLVRSSAIVPRVLPRMSLLFAPSQRQRILRRPAREEPPIAAAISGGDHRMRIAILTEFFPATDAGEITGGIEAVCFYITRQLEARGHNVQVLALRTDGSRWEWSSLASIPGRIAFVFRVFLDGLRADADVIEGTNQTVHLVAWAIGRLRRRPVVFHYHDVLLGNWERMGNAGRLGEAVERMNLRLRPDRYITPTYVVRRKLIQHGVSSDLISVIPNGYDEELIARVRTEAPAKSVTLTTICRLLRYKGTHIVIEAVRQLVDEGRDATLQVLGRGPELDNLVQQAARAGLSERVRFLGFVPAHIDVVRALAASTLLVSASTIEGFGIVLVEAMALGVPYVVCDIDAFREVTHGGRGGLLVNTDQPEALAAGIRLLLDDGELYREKSAEGVAVAAEYTWSRAGREVEALFELLTTR